MVVPNGEGWRLIFGLARRASLQDELHGAASADSAPPPGYTKEARTVTEKQAVKAGIRLPEMLRRCIYLIWRHTSLLRLKP